MIHGQSGIAIGEQLNLLLLGEDLLVEQVDLLGWHGVICGLSLFARSRGFAANVVERFFTVGTKFGVFEFPGLKGKSDCQFLLSLLPSKVSWCSVSISRLNTYILTIWRLTILFIILANLVEIVFVELAHKTGKVAMLEVFRQDGFGEFLALATVSSSVRLPPAGSTGAFTSNTTKLSPSSPQRTIDA